MGTVYEESWDSPERKKMVAANDAHRVQIAQGLRGSTSFRPWQDLGVEAETPSGREKVVTVPEEDGRLGLY